MNASGPLRSPVAGVRRTVAPATGRSPASTTRPAAARPRGSTIRRSVFEARGSSLGTASDAFAKSGCEAASS